MKNVFDSSDCQEFIDRINKLTPETQPLWGKMSVDKMLAHCNVTYEYIFENKYKKPTGIKKLFLKLLVKNFVVGEKPYRKNTATAPDFLIKNEKDFSFEKDRIIGFIKKVQELGAEHFDGKESHSFGPLNKTEWNNMLAKHLDHHLNQFGV
jgi:hypothetical protein